MKLVKQALLHYQQGSSDRVYEIDLCEVGAGRYVVNFRFGRRGAALREGSETASPVTLAEAERVYDKLVRSKIDKGYQEGRASERPAAPAPSSGGAARAPSDGGRPPPGADARAARVLARLWQTGAPAAPARPPARGSARASARRGERKGR